MAGLAVLALLITSSIGLSAANSEVQPASPPPWETAIPEGAEVVEDLYFVEFSEAPRAAGGNPARQANERANFRAQANAERVQYEQSKDFTTLWNGLTVRATPGEIAAIAALDVVTAVYPVAVIEAPEPNQVSPELATALAMTGADVVQSELGFTGEGLSVAIIDTGMDYNHPDLGGDGNMDNVILADPVTREMVHPRITHGWDYVGDAFIPADPATRDPNNDTMDPHGHGTHVGGIVGASAATGDGITGVAPGVTFGSYKVFGIAGSSTAEIIVEALEDAFVDGMDIVNMSLGARFAWGQSYPTTQASNELANEGVVVVNSAGNDGGLGTWTLSAPANAHDIISVASADNTHFDARVFLVEQLADPVPFMELSGAELPPTEGTSEELAWLGRACVDTLGDALLDDPEGKVALIVRGDCTFAEKYLSAANAGATGVVIYNNVAGMFAGTILDAGIEGVWGAGIGMADGEALQGLIEDGQTVVLEFTDETMRLPNPTGGLLSSFTSYGQDIELAFGPTITAPGGLINSTWPLALGGRATISGTSMSAPHVAGAAALLLEAESGLDPFEVRDRLQNTAQPAVWSLNPGLGLLDHTFRQGAGMLQIDRTILADQHATPGQLSLGDAPETTTTLTLHNRGDMDVTYAIGHVDGIQTVGSTFTPGFFLDPVEFAAPDSVTVGAGDSVGVTVTITAPGTGLANFQYGGWVTFTPVDDVGATALSVPYSGFDGSYPDGMPLLGYWAAAGGPFVDVEPFLAEIHPRHGARPVTKRNPTFNPHRGDFPVVAAMFGHFPQEMRTVAHHESGQSFVAMEGEFLPRSEAPNHFRLFAWTGRTVDDEAVPRGLYTLEFKVLRALGDPDNPDHWDTWESPQFRIEGRDARPGR
jgi:minor extracellular serine protease Vpr